MMIYDYIIIISYDYSNCCKDMLLSFLAGFGGSELSGEGNGVEMDKGATVGEYVCAECVSNLMMATTWRVESFF